MIESSFERIATGGAIRRWRQEGTVRLVCLPPAGGSSLAFRNLAESLPDHWSVIAVDPPGRGGDRTPPLTDIAALADWVVTVLAGITGPFLLLGHSLGAMVAWEVTGRRRLRVSGVVMCGIPSPDTIRPVERVVDPMASDEVLLNELSRLGGIPDVLLKSLDFASYFLPPLRADLSAYERGAREWSESAGRRRLPVPVLALAGAEDSLAGPAAVARWRDVQPGLRFEVLPGGHFFPQENAGEVARSVIAFAAGLPMSAAVMEDQR